ncbi:amidohydrolase [Kiritimatiella glycovorans]|uniref:5-methylthioadenosine/S-adenosylhomocysteine deaminase n=1 Tax=Kiritimatiella glycovorans TaxID=1307763 RepID=A0A0G3EJU4_9BACT|nr:amidohydrolase [Kiritimatiella glycovorans]AKJ64399.1 5-methylthioadenosine/S-adenosylhomocysteine deaminase [Kiritimatiella glycovorans]
MSLLIHNVRLDGNPTDIRIDRNRFTRIAPGQDEPADTVIDGAGFAILPTFHNGHTHAAMTLLRGYADDMDLETWLNRHIWPLESKLREEDVYNGARLACAEMIRSGTTFFNDMYWHPHGTARAADAMGLRADISAVFIDFHDPDKADEERRNNDALLRAADRYPDRIRITLGPHAVYTVSEASLRWAAEVSESRACDIHIHLAETEEECRNAQESFGCSPVAHLDRNGVLGPRTVAAHVNWVDEKEMDLLAERGVRVAHNPASNMKLASGSFPYADLAGRGIKVCLGTDGASSNNNLDMGETMKLAALHAKLRYRDPTVLGAEEVFELATGGAANLFARESGRIREGMLADAMLVNLGHPRLNPGYNLISDMVYAADSSCIDTVICDGRILMRGGVIEGEEEIVAKARESRDYLLGRP